MPETLSYTAALILQALHLGRGYGFEIMQLTELPSGTVYPALRRLEGAGLVASAWEDEDRAHAESRPARRYYQLSPAGSAALEEARARVLERSQLFAQAPASEGGA